VRLRFTRFDETEDDDPPKNFYSYIIPQLNNSPLSNVHSCVGMLPITRDQVYLVISDVNARDVYYADI
jgi:hypothetical protein